MIEASGREEAAASARSAGFVNFLGFIKSNWLLICVFAAVILQWGQFQQTSKLAERTADRLQAHELDTDRHVDRPRDERRWDDLIRRLDRLETKLDYAKLP